MKPLPKCNEILGPPDRITKKAEELQRYVEIHEQREHR